MHVCEQRLHVCHNQFELRQHFVGRLPPLQKRVELGAQPSRAGAQTGIQVNPPFSQVGFTEKDRAGTDKIADDRSARICQASIQRDFEITEHLRGP